MMAETEKEAKYIGRLQGVSGPEPYWDTGKVIDPVDFAIMKGFQTAVANAPTRKARRVALREVAKHMESLAKRVNVWAEEASIGVLDDGRVVINRPTYTEKNGQ